MQGISDRFVLKVNGGQVFVLPDVVFDKGQKLLLLHGFEIQFIFQQYGVLSAVVDEIMRRPLFPAVENRLMPPLVVLTAQDEGVLLPNKALGHLQSCVCVGLPKLEAGAFGVEHIDGGSGAHGLVHILECCQQEFVKAQSIHVVVFDGTVRPAALLAEIAFQKFRLCAVVHIVGRVGDDEVELCAAHQPLHIGSIGGIAAHEAVPA